MTTPPPPGPAPAEPPKTPPPPATPPPAAAPEGPPASLADRVAGIESKLDQLITSLHGKAADHTAARLDRNSNIEDAVRAEIARGQQEQAAREAAEAQANELGTLKTTVAKLTETPPAEPVRRIEKLFWPGRK